ncbi:hypothetical protein, partial [Cryobacterium sp. Y62]|uniref:hypothetical protein n=1 Tax=Cryobacterium sp. Y62 TaxID=2048284 RepID=UPI001E2BC5E5
PILPDQMGILGLTRRQNLTSTGGFRLSFNRDPQLISPTPLRVSAPIAVRFGGICTKELSQLCERRFVLSVVNLMKACDHRGETGIQLLRATESGR